MFIGMNLGDIQEAKPVPAGRYDLVISTAEFNAAKGDKGANIKVSLGVEGHDTSPNVTHFISIPKPDDDPQKAHFKQLMLKRFLTQFEVPYDTTTGFNVEDMPGCRASAMLTLSEPDENNNIYNRLQLEKLKTEA